MNQNPRAVRFRYFFHKLAVFALLFLFLALIGYVAFFVNRFYLEVVPRNDQEMTIEYGENFIDPGADARLAGTLIFKDGFPVKAKNVSQNNVDPSVPGIYNVEYDAKWLCFEGNGIRKVSVVDVTPPEITLNYNLGYFTTPGEPYQEEGFTAVDDCDGDVTAKVQAEEKDGVVIYTVSDSAGNTARIERQIQYKDTVPPVITLNGGAEYHIPAASEFIDPGFTATDNVDGDITHLVTVEGTVNPYIAGTYVLTYSTEDAEGNVTTVERTVVVDAAERAETVTPKEKTIYLTFDDGPSVHTEELLDVLKEYGVKATFFVVDTECVDLVSRIVEEGHSIGIHTISHDYKEIYASEEAFFADLLGMQQIIYEKSGVKTYLMRFPGGSSNTISKFNEGIMTRLTQAVEDAGFYYFDWNVDSNDAGGAKKAKQVFQNVTEGAEKRKVSIVLQHDTKKFSIEAVEKIICWGQENGYTFRGLDETSPGAHHGVNN